MCVCVGGGGRGWIVKDTFKQRSLKVKYEICLKKKKGHETRFKNGYSFVLLLLWTPRYT